MINLGKLMLQAKWNNEKQKFVFSCIDDSGAYLHHDLWKDAVFAWHESSFYGTSLDFEEEEVYLSPWETLEFFGKDSFNSLIDLIYSPHAMYFSHVASPMYEAIQKGKFSPDFERWQAGGMGWKMNDPSELQSIHPDEFELNPELKLDEFVFDWFSYAVGDLLGSDPMLQETWQEIEKAYPLVSSTGGDHFIADESGWHEKIGWKKDVSPFSVGLRLIEPFEDFGYWSLETVLRNKDNADEIVVWNGSLPRKWKGFEERVAREHGIWAQLVPWLSEDDVILSELTEQQAWDFLTEASELLVNAGVEILLPSWWQAIKDARLAVKAKVKSTVGSARQSFVGMQAILDFDWRFSTNGVELSEEEFLQLVDQKRRLINIRGRWIKIDPGFIKQVQAILEKANKQGLNFRDVLEQELLYGSEADGDDVSGDSDDLKIQIELNRHLTKMMRQLTEMKDIPEVDIPGSFQGELRPYQKQGAEWLLFLRKHGFGAILADDMGLGKTIQMIAYFLTVKEQWKPERPALIICPTSVLGNWQKEIEKFAPSLNVHLHYGSSRVKGEDFAGSLGGQDVVLTSYGLAHLDFEELASVEWSTICLDEAQNIKNAETKQSRAIRKLKGVHHIALSGTPMENRLTELWAIFDFTNHGFLGSLGSFMKRFVNPIEKDRDAETIAGLQRLIRPFLLRRTKTDPEVALNLPDKLEQKEYCPLTVEQASLYEQLVKDTFEQVEQLDGMQRKGLILKMLGKLKQVCDHPALYLKEERPVSISTRSTKMEKLLELVTNIRDRDESCLIFTQYIGMGEMIKEVLEKMFGEKVLFLNGSVSKIHRDEMIESFQNGEVTMLILSLKAGGTGLNLTAANHVIHYDRWWNPAVENQATDRAYRIGQKRFVHVHKFISTGTLEEKIDAMLEKKQSLNDEIITSENWITELSNDELKELLVL